MVALEEKLDHQSQQDVSSGNTECRYATMSVSMQFLMNFDGGATWTITSQ